MCGIIGYVGPRECKPLLLQGLDQGHDQGWPLAHEDRRDAAGTEAGFSDRRVHWHSGEWFGAVSYALCERGDCTEPGCDE